MSNIILKYEPVCEERGIWQCSGIDPYKIVVYLSEALTFFEVDWDKKHIENINLNQLYKILYNKERLRRCPDIILFDNPGCKNVKDISVIDFNAMLDFFGSSCYLINNELKNVGISMAVYSHDGEFYVTFYSYEYSVDSVVNKLLNFIVCDNIYSGVEVHKDLKFAQFKRMLATGVTINPQLCKIRKDKLILNMYVFEENLKFSEFLFPKNPEKYIFADMELNIITSC